MNLIRWSNPVIEGRKTCGAVTGVMLTLHSEVSTQETGPSVLPRLAQSVLLPLPCKQLGLQLDAATWQEAVTSARTLLSSHPLWHVLWRTSPDKYGKFGCKLALGKLLI